MDTKKALEILVQSVAIANRRGAFELAESKVIGEAVEVFTKKPENGTDTNTTNTGETKEEITSEEPTTQG